MTGGIEIAIVVLILLFSVILHEISHGIVALWNGDRTALEAKRLTLNPFPHIDLIGSIVLPLILFLSHTGLMFGWAKPVPFDPRYFKNRRLGIFTVGIAGPLTNVMLALIFSALIRFTSFSGMAKEIFLYGAAINLGLAVFNMMPIPPLDGSRAVVVLLPQTWRRYYLSLERWGFVIIGLLLYFGVFQRFVMPIFLKALQGLTGVGIE